MNNNLLAKLAVSGIKNNKKTVLPYVLVSGITIMLFNILRAMVYSKYIMNEGKPVFFGANYIVIFLSIGSIAVAIFSALFLFYGNQFVMKGRRKEIGLYGILGLSKRHVTVILLIEALLEAAGSLAMGIIAGGLLNKLMVLLLYKLTHQEPVKGLEFSVTAMLETLVFFGIVYGICLIYNLLTVRLGNPISLLKSENMGEKEPKVKGILLVIGLVCLAIGYYGALKTDSTFDAMGALFRSIIFVIIATYALFVAGSIFVLKMLKKNPRYYFRTQNFISVSNLLFRMKHNAVGLASICILSTGVILLMVCSGSLMALGEQNINTMFREDVMMHMENDDTKSENDYLAVVDKALADSNIDEKQITFRRYAMTACPAEKNTLSSVDDISDLYNFGNLRVVYFMTLEDYNHYAGVNETLSENEVLRYSSMDKVKENETVSIFGKDYVQKGKIGTKGVDYIFDSTMGLFGSEVIIVSDEDVFSQITAGSGEAGIDKKSIYMGFDSKEKLSDEQIQSFREAIGSEFGDGIEIKYKEEERSYFYGILGGAFFVGIFLAVLFLVETVMIIYYKQMSEGMEDQKRFQILSNAGLTDKE
ncbi:MAG: ABC transporter permease, partial [Butyrivibrio sp.]|nr:ABC transporter permease [Butyrivibrio sp.]